MQMRMRIDAFTSSSTQERAPTSTAACVFSLSLFFFVVVVYVVVFVACQLELASSVSLRLRVLRGQAASRMQNLSLTLERTHRRCIGAISGGSGSGENDLDVREIMRRYEYTPTRDNPPAFDASCCIALPLSRRMQNLRVSVENVAPMPAECRCTRGRPCGALRCGGDYALFLRFSWLMSSLSASSSSSSLPASTPASCSAFKSRRARASSALRVELRSTRFSAREPELHSCAIISAHERCVNVLLTQLQIVLVRDCLCLFLRGRGDSTRLELSRVGSGRVRTTLLLLLILNVLLHSTSARQILPLLGALKTIALRLAIVA